MIIRREWVVYCRCPDCGEPMSMMLRIQDQYFPHNDQSYLSPSMIMGGGDHLRCSICKVAHDPTRLEPILQQVKLQ